MMVKFYNIYKKFLKKKNAAHLWEKKNLYNTLPKILIILYFKEKLFANMNNNTRK